jgi:hypothetical protein
MAKSGSDARCVRSHVIGRVWSRWELSGLRPDASTVTSGRCMEHVWSVRHVRRRCAIGMAGRLSYASGRLRLTVGAQ